MKKSSFLIIIFLLNFGFIEYFFSISLINDISLAASFLLTIFLIFYYNRPRGENIINLARYNKYVLFFILLFFLSTLIPLFEYDQPVSSSLIALRQNYMIIFLTLLLKMRPTEREIYISLRFCMVVSTFFILYSIVDPSFFLTDEKLFAFQERTRYFDSPDLVTASPGANFLFFFFCMQCSSLIKKFSIKKLLGVVITFSIIFIIQNRSSLILAIPIFLYTLINFRTTAGIFYRVIIVILILFFSFEIFQIINSLLIESTTQFSNENYARFNSIRYFILDKDFNLLSFLFGNGLPATGSTYLDELLMLQITDYIYISDIGLIGTFYVYGLIFMLFFYSFIFKALKKHNPKYLKFFAIYVLLVPTIHGFGLFSSSVILFSLFFYLIIIQKYIQKVGRFNYHR